MRNRKVKQYSNGLKLVYKRNKRKEAVYFEFRFISGLYNDPQSKLGLAHFAEHCAGLTNTKYSRQEKNNYGSGNCSWCYRCCNIYFYKC